MPVGSDTQLQGLIDLARTGDPRAKSLLLDHACERLLKLTRKMFRGFNLAALQIRRELLDLKKRHFGPEGVGVHHHTDHQPADDAGGSLSRKADEPEDLSMWGEFHDRVGRLPDEQREVVNLLFYEGLTQEEASAILGISTRTLKRRWQEAKLQLHEELCDGSG